MFSEGVREEVVFTSILKDAELLIVSDKNTVGTVATGKVLKGEKCSEQPGKSEKGLCTPG